uniref:Uncharacterized protein n=1 Tax=Bionectria ochroleuca TaxID=29856 RepID=A0A8H7K7P1_BIOOC
MQDDLQRMELEAREEPKTTTGDSKARHARDPSLSTFIGQSQEGSQPQQQQQSQQPPQRPPKQPHQPQQPPVASQPHTYGGKSTNTTSAAAPPQSQTEPGGIRAYTGIMDLPDNAGSLGPSFSPFPKVKGDTIPPLTKKRRTSSGRLASTSLAPRMCRCKSHGLETSSTGLRSFQRPQPVKTGTTPTFDTPHRA